MWIETSQDCDLPQRASIKVFLVFAPCSMISWLVALNPTTSSKAPAQVKQIEVPAQFRDFTVQRMVRAASANSYDVPGELSTVMTKVLKAPERFEWVPVLCDTNSGPQTIRSLQSALQSRGLYNGAIDGIMGPQTRKALVGFQRGAGIPHLGYLTTDTMSALGLR